ncbi:MAG: hypothetical protein HXY34_02615 [Candidatus Thorarchaeota archaeon]|nr:hypothetical protein [Candidatus Thorarchaeota archaeon]
MTPAVNANPRHSLSQWEGGLIIDHNCISLSSIPSTWIDAAQADVRFHYAHTSHGSQIVIGLEMIEDANSAYSVNIGYCSLPTESGALCIYDGNGVEDYITPDLYWESAEGLQLTQDTLDNNPTLTVSMWSWCTQLNYYDQGQVQDYLDAIAGLEAANPDVTFVYMTCNAQADSSEGYNRHVNNEIIRQYCRNNDKVLFDFADLDCWHNGVHSTYSYFNGTATITVPVEHPDFHGDEAGHTTYTSCEQKGKAFWWMVAMLAGWNAPPPPTSTTSGTTTSGTTTSSGFQQSDNMVLTFSLAVIGVLVVACVVSNRRYGR